MQKVTKLIDIKAPCKEVFDTVVNIDKRMQLSPLWGLSRLLEVAPNYPEPSSSYRVQVLTDAPFGLSHGTLNASHSALAGLAQFLSLKLYQSTSSSTHSPVINSPERLPTDVVLEGQTEFPTEQKYYVAEYQPTECEDPFA